jgi:hypothetical protein
MLPTSRLFLSSAGRAALLSCRVGERNWHGTLGLRRPKYPSPRCGFDPRILLITSVPGLEPPKALYSLPKIRERDSQGVFIH